MKKIILLILFIGSGSAFACDYCNCYLGLDPGYNKNTIGLRAWYRYATMDMAASSGMRTLHGGHSTGTTGINNKVEESFLSTEIFARFYPVKKLQLVASIPYQFNSISYMDDRESLSSLADVTILALYQLFNTMPVDSLQTRHRFFAGLGVKFPLGKSTGTSDLEIPMAHDLNTGTGSTDLIFLMSYIGKKNKIGWSADASYKLNGESTNKYQFGNTFNITPRIFYEVKIKETTLLPHLGLALENSGKDRYYDKSVEASGGSALWGCAGLDFYFGKFSIKTEACVPAVHDFSDEIPEDKIWLNGSFNFHF